jgi:hypothetical protein
MINYTSASPGELTERQRKICEALSRIHGDVNVARESSGIHLYMSCPCCLEEDGKVEMSRKHLTINLTKLVDQKHAGAILCMKRKTKYQFQQLIEMPNLEQRGYKYIYREGENDFSVSRKTKLEEIKPGLWVPKLPGETIPLGNLDEDHPAIQYLLGRNFVPSVLEEQFAASWCVEELDDENIFYRRGPKGFHDTPQDRIIFFAYQDGDRVGWQGRYLETKSDTQHEVFHPYRHRWEAIRTRSGPGEPWEPVEGLEKFSMSKYLTAAGMSRNQMLMGYDATRRFNADITFNHRFVILTEGPLDAGRFGPPACPTLGKFVSIAQLRLARQLGQRIIYVSQNDDDKPENPAKAARERLRKMSVEVGIPIEIVLPPPGVSDVGELASNDIAWMWLKSQVSQPIPKIYHG